MKLHVKAKDQVIVIAGKDKGKKGAITAAFPKTGKVIVEGVNLVTKHQKPRGQGMQGGIIEQEAAIPACKVMLVCPKCKKPTRIGHKMTDGEKARKVRVCKKCGAAFDN